MTQIRSLALKAALTDASGSVNEDAWGRAGNAAWVCDGATGVNSFRRCPGQSDAAWLVAQMVQTMAECAGADLALDQWSTFLESSLEQAFVALGWPDDLSAADMPAAAFSAVQVRGDRLLGCNLGDCAIILRTRDGQMRRLGTSRVEQFDKAVLGLLNAELKSGGSHKSAQPAMLAQILSNRAKANTPDGYWVANPRPGWADHVQTFDEDLTSVDRVLLASDGFLRLVDEYAIHPDMASVMDSDQAGLQRELERVRGVERNDPDCRLHPRIKPADDATAVLFEVGVPQ